MLLSNGKVKTSQPLRSTTAPVGVLGHKSTESKIPSLSESGQPLDSTDPTTSGQLSSLSGTPSPSESGHGHPLLSGEPTSSIHSSTLSPTPSPSVSGHPFISGEPGSFWQASTESPTPSPSESTSINSNQLRLNPPFSTFILIVKTPFPRVFVGALTVVQVCQPSVLGVSTVHNSNSLVPVESNKYNPISPVPF